MILVTGGTGYLGRALVRRLLQEGERVRVLVRRGAQVCGESSEGDVTQPHTLAGAMRGVHTVFHLAALVDHSAPEERLWRVNVDGTRHVVAAAVAAGVARFVHCSSVSAEPGGGSTAYGRSKIAAERALEPYRDRIEIVTLRPGPIYDHERRNLRRLVRLARILRIVPRPVPDAAVHLASRRNVVEAFLLARSRGVPSHAYAICDAQPVARATLAAIVAQATGARALPLPTMLVRGALLTAALGAEAMAAAFGTRPLIDRHYVRVLARERRYAIGPAQTELGYLPAPTEQHFAEAVEAILAQLGAAERC
jgi:dihydroflavonol-4-reductase